MNEQQKEQTPGVNPGRRVDGELMFKIIGEQQYTIAELTGNLMKVGQQAQAQQSEIDRLREALKDCSCQGKKKTK